MGRVALRVLRVDMMQADGLQPKMRAWYPGRLPRADMTQTFGLINSGVRRAIKGLRPDRETPTPRKIRMLLRPGRARSGTFLTGILQVRRQGLASISSKPGADQRRTV
jgi:hypothetical protein